MRVVVPLADGLYRTAEVESPAQLNQRSRQAHSLGIYLEERAAGNQVPAGMDGKLLAGRGSWRSQVN